MMNGRSRVATWFLLGPMTIFCALTWTWASVISVTAAAPATYQTTFDTITLPLGMHWLDFAAIPTIWGLFLIPVIPSPLKWAMASSKEKRLLHIHAASFIAGGLCLSLIVSPLKFNPWPVGICAAFLAVQGFWWGTIAGMARGEAVDGADISPSAIGTLISLPVAITCGTVVGLVMFFAYTVPFLLFFWSIYGLRRLVRLMFRPPATSFKAS